MTWIKICGITRQEDALLAARLGVDAIGFNFYRASPRYIEPEKAARIVETLPEGIEKVGVFVNEVDTAVRAIFRDCKLDMLQFHGDEPLSYCTRFHPNYLKAFRLENRTDLLGVSRFLEEVPVPRRFLLDTYHATVFGGGGKTFDWDLALDAKEFGEVVLSGGLTPDNIRIALAKVRPFGVDVASGIEGDSKREAGIKDPEKLRRFVETVRKWDRSQKGKV